MTQLGVIARPLAAPAGLAGTTLPGLLQARAAADGEAGALLHKHNGAWHRWTWRQLDAEVTNLAGALAAYGVLAGERVLIAGANRPRLLAGLLAAQRLGAVPVLVPQVGAGVPIAQAIAETAPRIALVADVHEVDALRAAPPALVVYADGRRLVGEDQPWLMGWERFAATAASALPPPPAPTDPAAVVYVADEADGFHPVTLSHAGLIAAVESLELGPADRIFAALPFGWGEPLLLGPVLALVTGATIGFPEADATVLTDLCEFAPTVLAGPAELFRHMWRIAWTEAAKAGPLGRALLQQGLGLGAHTHPSNRFAAAFAAGPMRRRLGLAQLRHALQYGETVAPRIASFWTAIGVDLTRFAAPGGLRPRSTSAQTASAAASLRGSPYIRNAWLVETEHAELAALLALDTDAVAAWAQTQGFAVPSTEALASDERVHSLISGEIAAVEMRHARITTYLITTSGFDAASGETTPEGWARPAMIERSHAITLRRLRNGLGHTVARADEHQPRPHDLADLQIVAALHGYGM